MTAASDQQPDAGDLSLTSRRMLELREAVFDEWEQRVRASLDKAKNLDRPVLVDTLPAFYDNIAESLNLDYPRATAAGGTTSAAEHGGERARITSYDNEALIGEYQLFRWAIFDVFYRGGLSLSRQEVLSINASIDTGIQEAVAAFSLVHSTLREQFAAALAHDLRGPLSAASTALELIAIINDVTKMKSLAVKALDNVHRMSGMVNELLDTMAFHSGERLSLTIAQFDIWEVIQEVQVEAVALHGPRVQTVGSGLLGGKSSTG